MAKPYVDLSECTLCGICTEIAPDVFQMNDAGYVEILEMDTYPEDIVRDAIKNCPASCIHTEDD
jgi:ferredoxin